MRCTRCREEAWVDVRRHNAAFCGDCFLHHFREQVERAISHDKMLGPGSGCWWRSRRQGLPRAVGHPAASSATRPTASTSGSASATTPTSPGHVRAVRGGPRAGRCTSRPACDHGYDVPVPLVARQTRRAPCSACGLSKRHLFNRGRARARLRRRRHRPQPRRRGRGAARQRAALGDRRTSAGSTRCCPRAPGFARKVKPLVRSASARPRRTACLAGHRLPWSRSARWPRQRHLDLFKEVLNALEDRSPGTKAAFLFGFLDSAPGVRRRTTRTSSARASSASSRRPPSAARSVDYWPRRASRASRPAEREAPP